MNYQEAIEFKKQLGKDHIIIDELPMRIIITPSGHNDFTRYVTNYRTRHFSDETSKQYSKDGQFKVHGFWTDGTNVIYKDLTI